MIICLIIIRGVDFIISKWNCFNELEYQDGIITPLYDADEIQYIDARDYAERCIGKVLDYGCILNVYISNKHKSPIMVSETSVIIDEIREEIYPQVYIIGVYSEKDNVLTLYAINNGTRQFQEGKIYVKINHYEMSYLSSEYLKEKQVISLLGDNGIIEINNLRGGEIRRLVSYNLNETVMKELELVSINYDIISGEDSQFFNTEERCIGLISYNHQEIAFSFSEGDSSDVTVKRNLMIDVDNDKGKELSIPANFLVEGNYLKNIFYALYPNSSCELTFHAKIKCAGKTEYIETEKFTQKIYVPLYKEEGGHFLSIREFIDENDIDVYYYDSNPIIQREIIYEPTFEK